MNEDSIIQFQDLEDIPGIGSITAERLREIGIFTPKQLSLYGIDELSSLLDLTDLISSKNPSTSFKVLKTFMQRVVFPIPGRPVIKIFNS